MINEFIIGTISGVVSGIVVSIYFRFKDALSADNKELSDAQNELLTYLEELSWQMQIDNTPGKVATLSLIGKWTKIQFQDALEFFNRCVSKEFEENLDQLILGIKDDCIRGCLDVGVALKQLEAMMEQVLYEFGKIVSMTKREKIRSYMERH